MKPRFRNIALIVALLPALPAVASPLSSGASGLRPDVDNGITLAQYGISRRPQDYSNGNGTNAANSYAVGRPVGPYGGYVVNEYGFGNYVSGPQGFGGYPAGSADAQIWRQREQWKCQNVPETC